MADAVAFQQHRINFDSGTLIVITVLSGGKVIVTRDDSVMTALGQSMVCTISSFIVPCSPLFGGLTVW